MSRPDSTLGFGKNTERVDTSLPEATKESLVAMAWAVDMTVSEYIRLILLGHVHGNAALLKARHGTMRIEGELR